MREASVILFHFQQPENSVKFPIIVSKKPTQRIRHSLIDFMAHKLWVFSHRPSPSVQNL